MAAGDLALAISISAIDSASSVIKGIADSLVGLAGEGALGAVAAAGVAAAAGLAAVGVAGAKAAGDFQQQLNMLVTSAGESASNLGMVSDGILKISTDTGTATNDLTSALYNINSGGKIGADGLHILQIASEGAKTENADLTTVTKALMTTMTDYKMPTQDATGAMNGLIAAVQNGRTTLQAMATAMGQVLPIASSMGMSFPQVAGALDALTNAGVSAQQGAQNLAHFLVALQAPGGVAQKAMKEVGISAQDLKDTLVSKGLPAALQMIEDHIGTHLPAGSVQAETAMKNITGGLVGLKAAADITGQGLQKTVDATNKIAAAMGDASAGVSGWDLVQSGFNFQIDRAQAALSALLIVLGEKLLPILTPIVAGFTNVVTGITDMITGVDSGTTSSNAFVAALQNVVKFIGDFISQVQQVASTVSPIFDGLATSAQTWGSNFINSFGQGVMSALGGIVDAVVQVITEIESYLGFASPTRKGPGQNVAKWGRGLAQGLAGGMLDGIPDLQDAAGSLMSVTTKVVAPGQQATTKPTKGNTAAKSLTTGLSSSLSSGAGALTSGVNAIGAQLSTVCSTHAASASKCASSTLTTGLASSIKSGTSAVKSASDSVGSATSGAGTGAAKSAKTAADHLTTGLADKVKAATPKAKKAATDLGTAVAGAIAPAMKVGSDGFNGISKAAGDMANKLKAAGDSAKTALSPLAQGLKAALAGIGTIFDNIKKAAQAAFEYMKPGLSQIGGIINNTLLPAFKDLAKTLTPVAQFFALVAIKAVEGTVNFVKWATSSAQLKQDWDGIVVVSKIVIQTIAQFVSAISDSLKPVIKQLSDTFNTQLKPSFDQLKKVLADNGPALKQLGDIIKSVLVLALGILVGAITGVIEGLGFLVMGLIKVGGGIVEVFSGLIALLSGIAHGIYDLFTGNFRKLDDDLTTMQDGLLMMFKGGWDMIVGALTASLGFIAGLVSGFCSGITTFFQNLYNDLIGHSIIPDIINGIQNWFNKLLDFIPTLMTKIVKFFTDGWATIQKDVDTALKAINTAWTNFGTAVLKIIQDGWTKVQQLFQNAYTTYIKPGLDTIIKLATTWYTGFLANFGTWGKNLIDGFAVAITNAIPGVTTAVTAVATTIKSILGIASPAQTGPLSTSDTWMSNLMKMFTGQITAATPGVASATSGLAGAIKTQIDKAVTGLKASIADLQTQINSLKDAAKTTATSVTGSMQQVSGSTKTAMNDSNAAMMQMNQNMLQELQHAQEVNAKLANANNIIVVQTKTTADQVSAADSVMANTSKDALNTVTTNNAKTTLNMHDSVVTVQQDQTIMDKVDNYVIAQGKSIQNQVVTSVTSANTQLAQQTKVVVDWGKWAGGQITISNGVIDKWGAQVVKTVQQDTGWAGNQINISDKVIDTWWNNLSKTITKDISSTQSSIDSSNKTITAAESSMTGQVKQAGTMASQASVYAGQSTVSAAASNTEASLSSTFKSASQAYASGSASYAGTSGNYAGISVDGFTLSGAAATGSAQGASSSTQSSSISNSMLHTSNAAASGAVSAAAASTSSAGASTSAAGAASSASSASKSFMSSSLDSASGSKAASGFSSKASSDSKTYAGMAESSANQASKSSANAHTVGAQLSAYVAQLGAQIGAQIAGLQASVASAASGMVAAAQGAAAAAAALLAHSKPKEGPMKDDDQWMHHFMDNLIKPIHDDIPRLARACKDIADTVGGAVGGTTGGVTSPVAAGVPYTITTGHSIPITILPPPAAATPTTQPPVVIHTHVDLDGREIGKCTTKYLQKEIHEQGGYKRR